MRAMFLILAIVTLGFANKGIAETRLYMAEESSCPWCKRWHEEVGHIYPKTPEGKAAPLVTFNLHGQIPEIETKMKIQFTPTFLLVVDGKEKGRIEGYPGEDFFWGLLGMLFEQADLSLKPVE